MANTKLTDLSAVTASVDADLLYMVTDVATTPASKKITVENFKSDLEPTLPSTPSDPANKFLNGNRQWSSLAIGSGGFAANVYATLEDSDVETYKKLSYTAPSGESAETIVVNNNTVTDLTVLYDDPMAVTVLPSGTWRAVVYAKVDSTIGATTMSLTAFVRDASGNEDDLFTMTSETIENTADYLRFVIESSQPTIDVDITDRFGLRIKGTTTRTSNTTITYIVGDGRGLYINTTLPLRHNQLRLPNEDDNYRHISTTEYANISGAADGDNNGYLSSANWTTFNNKQAALTFGIADNNAVQIDSATVADDDFAKFTAQGLEGRSASEVLSDIGALGTAGGTMSGNITLGENTSIALDPAGSADGKYTGITVTGTAGATVAFGDLITLDKDDSRWEKVDISVAAAATGDARGIMGMAVSAGDDGDTITILLNGIIRADANFPALTIGAAVYASTTGDIVVTQPSTKDYVIRLVGYALTADEIYFNPENDWITHT